MGQGIARHCRNISAHESRVRAFVEGTLDVDRILDDFAGLSDRLAGTEPKPPLFGRLLGVKDIVNVDGYPTRCGSDLPPEMLGGPEASCVTRLRGAGAVVAGKTVTTEFAISDPGPTCNPRNLAHTPGGSSSGSAAGVAAGFFDLAIGSQTGGSVIRPAAYCGVVGFKPSLGRIPTDGVFPYSPSIDQLGLFAARLAVIEQVMTIVARDWRVDAAKPPCDLRIGVPEGPYLGIVAAPALQAFRGSLARLREAGLKIEPVEILGDFDRQNEELERLTYAEAYRVHRPWFEEFRLTYKPLTLDSLALGKSVSDEELADLRQAARRRQNAMRRTMLDLGLTAWVAPAATGVAPPGLGYTGDHRMNGIWTYTGLPAVTIPAGKTQQNLPYGLQIVGRYNEDKGLLAMASTIQDLLADEPIVNAWDRSDMEGVQA